MAPATRCSSSSPPTPGRLANCTAGSIDDAERIFAGLTDGGTVEMPLEEVFWALRFGSVVDRFGTSWMISVDHPADPSAT
jgi:PhnB protein